MLIDLNLLLLCFRFWLNVLAFAIIDKDWFEKWFVSSGVYPSGVVPYEILDSCGGEEKSLPSSLADEIKTATERARDGYSRITNLCRCISHAVHSGFLKNQMVGN